MTSTNQPRYRRCTPGRPAARPPGPLTRASMIAVGDLHRRLRRLLATLDDAGVIVVRQRSRAALDRRPGESWARATVRLLVIHLWTTDQRSNSRLLVLYWRKTGRKFTWLLCRIAGRSETYTPYITGRYNSTSLCIWQAFVPFITLLKMACTDRCTAFIYIYDFICHISSHRNQKKRNSKQQTI